MSAPIEVGLQYTCISKYQFTGHGEGMRHFTLLGILMLHAFNSIIRICLVFNGVTILEIRINGLKVIFIPTVRTIEASIIYISMSFSFLYVVQQICNVMGVRVGSRFVF